MARIRSDLQIEKGLPAGNKVLAKPDGQVEVVQIEPYKVSPTTWIVDSAGIYENTPGQFEIPSLPYAKDVDTAISDDGKIYKYNSAGYFELAVDLSASLTALQPGDNVSELNNDAGYVDATGAANAAPVQSVNGETGAVSLDANDVGAIDVSEKGANNGVATLDGGGKVPATQLPNSVMTLEGEWNASTNTPTLSDGMGNPGMIYEVTVAGTQDLGSGNISFNVGDFVVYGNDGIWYKSINSNEVVSVNGQTGVVVLDADDIDDTSASHKFVTQGEKDDIASAVQPGDLASVATSGDYDDLLNKPTIPDSLDDLSGTLDDITDGSTYVKSENNFTDTEKNKLAGVESGANVNVNADWNSSTGDSEILNKPNIPSESTDLTDSADLIRNNTDTYTSEAKINQIVTLTQAEYDAIPSPDPNTLYIIPEV